jgi:hypothetical protein
MTEMFGVAVTKQFVCVHVAQAVDYVVKMLKTKSVSNLSLLLKNIETHLVFVSIRFCI